MHELPSPPEGTAAELLAAGLRLFGQKGFAATSTRELAAAAGTNVASIAYHFGSKEGLRRACGAEVVRRMARALAAPMTPPPVSREEAARRMEAVLRAMAAFVLTSEEAEPILPFMLRELSEAGPVFDAVYGTLMEPMHRRFCALWAAATGQKAESPRTRLLVFTLVGQILYFRIGSPIVTRRMGWDRIGPSEADAIADLLALNLRTLLEREARP